MQRAGERVARETALVELEIVVAADAAALQVEQLCLVDRTDRRGMHCPPAIRLVDLEAGDGHGTRAPRQVHPELTEKAVGADRRLFDGDEPLHVRPGRAL